ncbi:response regulator transcription factor [Noviherbaspirillum humi]|nr:response regulator [Noviherbaspirillum humi]
MNETVFVVDDDEAVRDALTMLFKASGLAVESFASAAAFLHSYRRGQSGCLVLDLRMPGMSGLALQEEMARRQIGIPIVFLSGHADVPVAVRALKQGAVDFIEKPIDSQRLLPAVQEALKLEARKRLAETPTSQPAIDDARFADLTQREREVLTLVWEGRTNKAIAEEMGISVKTVEFHRARLCEKLQVASLADFFRQNARPGA